MLEALQKTQGSATKEDYVQAQSLHASLTAKVTSLSQNSEVNLKEVKVLEQILNLCKEKIEAVRKDPKLIKD
jgi:hypothetical protein